MGIRVVSLCMCVWVRHLMSICLHLKKEKAGGINTKQYNLVLLFVSGMWTSFTLCLLLACSSEGAELGFSQSPKWGSGVILPRGMALVPCDSAHTLPVCWVLLKHEIYQVADVSKYCFHKYQCVAGFLWGSFVAISEGHIRIFCSSTSSTFLTTATILERILHVLR